MECPSDSWCVGYCSTPAWLWQISGQQNIQNMASMMNNIAIATEQKLGPKIFWNNFDDYDRGDLGQQNIQKVSYLVPCIGWPMQKRRWYQILDFSYLIFPGRASHSGIVYCTKPSSAQYQLLPPMALKKRLSRVHFAVQSMRQNITEVFLVDTSQGVADKAAEVGKCV